jgi:hypothetical protein
VNSEQWSEEDLRNALAYGFCLVCRRPHELRVTETVSEGHTSRHVELVKPCGHTSVDVDAELERLA